MIPDNNMSQTSLIKKKRLPPFNYRSPKFIAFIAVLFTIAAMLIVVGLVLDKRAPSKQSQKSVSVENNTNINDPYIPEGPNAEEKARKTKIIDWQKSVKINTNNPSQPVDYEQLNDGEVIEQIDENQIFDETSLQLPDGWTAQWSADDPSVAKEDRTFNDFPVTNSAEVRFIKIKIGNKDGLMPMAQTSVVEPLSNISIAGRDNYRPSEPILYKKKIYQVMMAVNVVTNPTQFTIDCFDLSTYARCTEVAYPTYVSSTIGSLGSGTKDISTAMNLQLYLDDGTYGNEGRLYFAGQQANNYGVACVDLEAQSNCGFTVMGSGTAPTGTRNPALIAGFVRKDDRLYGHANDADKTTQTVVCFDLNLDGLGTDGKCPEYTDTTLAGTQTYNISEHSGSYQSFGAHIISGNKLYWTVAYRHTATNMLTTQAKRGNVITCFDLTTRQKCTRTDGGTDAAGWSHPFGGQPSFTDASSTFGAERGYANYIWRKDDVPGTPGLEDHAICTLFGLGAFGSAIDPGSRCFDLGTGLFISGGAGVASPSSMLVSQWLTVPWQSDSNVKNITDDNGHEKSYFPLFNTVDTQANSPKRKGATLCYDWTTQTRCENFAAGKPRYWHDINLGDSADVGYVYDGYCMWAAGSLNNIWSFNAETGEFPCRTSQTVLDVGVQNQRFYCDGVQRAFEWDRVRLAKTNLYNFDKLLVEVQDPNGNVLQSTEDIKDNGFVSISNIDYQQHPELKLVVVPTVLNTSPWANNKKPIISALLKSDDVQYCYKTSVKNICDIDSVNTVSEAQLENSTDVLSAQQTESVGVYQPENEQCFRDLKPTVTPNKTVVTNDQQVTYTINVQNKANKDNDNRGDIPNQLHPETASLEATIPSGLTFVSATNSGVLQGSKVVWSNQSYPADEIEQYTVVLRAPSSTALKFNEPADKGKVYAATTQTPLTMQATVQYGDDYYPSDNTASDNSVIFSNTTLPPPDPANVNPIITTTVSETNKTAPASFTVSASATDSDGSITKIEILQNGQVAKTCLNAANCTLNAEGYTAGTYTFSSKAYDNATPSGTATSSTKTVTVSSPPVVPTANKLPTISMTIPEKSVTAPGKFSVTSTATDSDGTITKIEIIQDGEVIKTCTDKPDCTLSATDYKVNSYSFSAKAYDNATPPGTATTQTQVVEVLASGSSAGGAATAQTQNNTPTTSQRSIISRITTIPQRVGESLGAAITVTARAVKPVPPAVARAVPYTLIALIAIFSGYYFYQSYAQARSQRMLAELSRRFKQTQENRKNYIDLTSHYISTPITTISSTLELQESLKTISGKVLEKAKKYVTKLKSDSSNLLKSSQELPGESASVVKSLESVKEVTLYKKPSFIIPIVSVLAVVVVSNLVFVRADKYSASVVNFVLQSSFFVIAVGTLVASFNSVKKQRKAYALADKEFKLEQDINNAQTKFIADSSSILTKDVAQLDEVAPQLSKGKYGDKFTSGFKSLKKAVSKFAYLNLLTTSTIKLHSEPVNLKTLADEVLVTYRPIALQSKLNLRVDIDPSVMAVVDPQGFKYILISVLDNAIKFTKPGGDIVVTIANQNKQFALLKVQDTGAGIPKKKVDALFTPFTRGTDTMKFDYEGMGLDLYMDKLIAEQAGGTIKLSSIEGAYTTVTVQLPRKQ